MKILVLSDLHIGEKARGKDMCPSTLTNKWLDDNYKQDFINYISSEHITADYIIITGDISNTGAFDEFTLANTIIRDIASAIGLEENKILIVPGNHDVDWMTIKVNAPISAEESLFRKGRRYDALKAGLKYPINTLIPPYFDIWDFDDLLVVGYNSAWHDGGDQLIHNGTITNETIAQIEQAVKDKNPGDKIKLFITHHHLFQYSDPIPNDPDFSIMNNAENLLKMLSTNKFDMIIHGHKHVPRIHTIDIGSIHPLAMLCAGSFSVILDQRFSGVVLNMFHLVNFEGRDTETGRIYGFVENFSFCSHHKWLKSQKNNSNVLSKHGFGSYNCIPLLKRELTPVVTSKIQSKGAALWSDLCQGNRMLQYHTPEFIAILTDEIASDLGLVKYITETEIIFVNHG